MRILFYTPFNTRSRDTETLMEAFVKQGHEVFLLTQVPYGIYHEYCEKLGVSVHTHVISKTISLFYFLKHSIYLIKFCKINRIELVYAHLENAGLPAVLAQYFMKSKVIACRHVIDEAFLIGSRKFVLLNKIVYTLCKNCIVVSARCKNWMVEKEGIRPDKIKMIPLAYNFNFYEKPNPEIVAQLKKKYSCKMLFLTACRQIKSKRTHISINLVNRLRKEGFDVKLIILGSGPNLDQIKQDVKSLELEDAVFVLGFQTNIMDYISACDLLVHPSITDSSSVIIKEAGLNDKPVLVCSGIGDVDDYLTDGVNAFMVSQEDTENEMLLKVKPFFQNQEYLKNVGKALHQSVVERFDISKIIHEYDKLHTSLV